MNELLRLDCQGPLSSSQSAAALLQASDDLSEFDLMEQNADLLSVSETSF